MNKSLFPFTPFTLAMSVMSAVPALADQAQQQINDHLNDQRIQSETSVIVAQPQSFQAPVQQAKPTTSGGTLSISKEELAKYPELVIRALLPAVSQGHSDHVALLFPIYQQLPSHYQNPILTKWAEAILARKAQRHSKAIGLYREILATQSGILPARLQLAITLFENNELEAAEDQFQKLRAEPLAPEIEQVIVHYLNAIQRRDPWTFGGGLTYLRDPNINNAPKAGTTYGNWTPPKAESAQGVGYHFDIGKKWSWGNGFFNELRLGTNGKHYWDNRKYNELSLRGSVGLGFQNGRLSVAVLPFMEQVLYSGGSKNQETLKRFSKSGGATLEASYWLSPKWRLNNTYEYGEQRYISRKHLNGNYHFISSSLLYFANAKQYWFLGVNYNRTQTRDRDDSFFRRGVNVGWGQEWGLGFSTRLSVNMAQKRYKGPMPIFNIVQRNREYGVQASVWHRAVHFFGVTPRLTYNFNKIQSNHVFYSYDKQRVFLELSKQF